MLVAIPTALLGEIVGNGMPPTEPQSWIPVSSGGAELGQHTMGEEGEAPPAGYYEFGSDPPSGEGQRNDNKERHGQGQAWFANGDR